MDGCGATLNPLDDKVVVAGGHEMPVNEEDVVNIMGGMPEGIRLNDHRRRLKNRQKT